MVIDWRQNGKDEEAGSGLIRAAEYVRMSTEHQKYSADNQSVEIHKYAALRGYQVVKKYADKGKSGLNIEGRKALQQLLHDIESGQSDFDMLIVYDVSRWGRFQDVDEAASYELRCRQAGVEVHYCAEQFENDGSIGSSIIKTVKRAMAGEYSRELSVKVFAGQSHLIKLGYRQGGAAGFGLRRMLVDENGNAKNLLRPGEHKSIATDRVILVPGPQQEIDTVREIYDLFVGSNMPEREIASKLNRLGILNHMARKWTRGTVHQLLINEKYIGNNVWGRTSFKLQGARSHNEPENWIRADGVFEAIVDRKVFEAAQNIIAARSNQLSDDEMLGLLKSLLDQKGTLSGLIIDETEEYPSSGAFGKRFGGLLRAYALVGFEPGHDYSFLEANRRIRRLHPAIFDEIKSGIEAAGSQIEQDEQTDLLTINQEFTVSLCLMRCFQTKAGSYRWKLKLDTPLNPDITIAARMNPGNETIKDYYILPLLDMGDALLRLAEYNGLSFDAYRTETLEPLFKLSRRRSLRQAA